MTDTIPCAFLIVAENMWLFAKPKKTKGAHSSGKGLQTEIPNILLTAHWIPGRAYLTRLFAPIAHISERSHVFYLFPVHILLLPNGSS